MKRLGLFLILVWGFIGLAQAAYVVPSQVQFAGIRLMLKPRQQAFIQKEVDKLTLNQLYFNVLKERANLFMPFVEQAFRHIGVPQDLKYICLQESALLADAVSTSNAVGFWQFKDFTGREVGLRIDGSVDERKHIFRASCGAAIYFQKNFYRHRNWVYAVISYYTGGTGAIPHIDTTWQRGQLEMVIDDKVHWYALKAIAHKLAFEHELDEPNPHQWLEPRSNSGEVLAVRLAERANIPFSEFRRYNTWMKAPELPANRPFSFFVPHQQGPVQLKPDPHPELFQPAPPPVGVTLPPVTFDLINPKPRQRTQPRTETERPASVPVVPPPAEPKPAPVPQPIPAPAPKPLQVITEWIAQHREVNAPAAYAKYDIEKEPLYAVEFIQLGPKQTLTQLADKYALNERKLRRWNGWSADHQPKMGDLVKLVRPLKAQVHIAGEHQTLGDIALFYNLPLETVVERNPGLDPNRMLIPGTKVYLKTNRPETEKIIVYRLLEWEQITRQIGGASSQPVRSTNTAADAPAPKGWQEHVVQNGETLQTLAQRYKTTVEVLQQANGMRGQIVTIGMRLKVPKP